MNKLNSKLLGIVLCILFSPLSALANPIHEFVRNQDLLGLCDFIEANRPSLKEVIAKDKDGKTAIEVARESQNALMVKLLGELEFFLASWEQPGKGPGLASPLQALVRRNHLWGVHIYLTYNPISYEELMTVDWRDENPMDIAREAQNWEMLDLLRASAAYIQRAEREAAHEATIVQTSEESTSEANTPRVLLTVSRDDESPRVEENDAVHPLFFLFDEEHDAPTFLAGSRID